MTIDLDADWIVTTVVSLAAMVGGLYARTIQAENRTLRLELTNLKDSYKDDMQRIDNTHDDLWTEIKMQRESLAQNREAVIKLNSSIERLNEILPKLEAAVTGKVSRQDCATMMGRRWSDKPLQNIGIGDG